MLGNYIVSYRELPYLDIINTLDRYIGVGYRSGLVLENTRYSSIQQYFNGISYDNQTYAMRSMSFFDRSKNLFGFSVDTDKYRVITAYNHWDNLNFYARICAKLSIIYPNSIESNGIFVPQGRQSLSDADLAVIAICEYLFYTFLFAISMLTLGVLGVIMLFYNSQYIRDYMQGANTAVNAAVAVDSSDTSDVDSTDNQDNVQDATDDTPTTVQDDKSPADDTHDHGQCDHDHNIEDESAPDDENDSSDPDVSDKTDKSNQVKTSSRSRIMSILMRIVKYSLIIIALVQIALISAVLAGYRVKPRLKQYRLDWLLKPYELIAGK